MLVVGYGRVGRLVGDMLGRHDIAWVAAERDPKLVEQGRRAGESIFFGDASRAEFLLRCGLADAPALVVTMDDPEGVEAIVATARELRPDLTIVARARDARHAQRLYDLGATDAVPETVEASLQLSEAVLVEIGVPMGLVIASIHERRDEFRKALNRPEVPRRTHPPLPPRARWSERRPDCGGQGKSSPAVHRSGTKSRALIRWASREVGKGCCREGLKRRQSARRTWKRSLRAPPPGRCVDLGGLASNSRYNRQDSTGRALTRVQSVEVQPMRQHLRRDPVEAGGVSTFA